MKSNIALKNNLVFFAVIASMAAIFLLNKYGYFSKEVSVKEAVSQQQLTQEEDLQQKAIIAVKALKFRNFKLLQEIIHPKLGVRVSPYAYILSSDKIIAHNEMENLYYNDQQYQWGYDNKRREINLDFASYYKQYIYNQDFANYDELLIDSNIDNPTKMLDNAKDFYADAMVVEFKINGILAENQGKDWTALRLIFSKYKSKWYLIGIINLRGIINIYDEIEDDTQI